jgi:hypothetical protein
MTVSGVRSSWETAARKSSLSRSASSSRTLADPSSRFAAASSRLASRELGGPLGHEGRREPLAPSEAGGQEPDQQGDDDPPAPAGSTRGAGSGWTNDGSPPPRPASPARARRWRPGRDRSSAGASVGSTTGSGNTEESGIEEADLDVGGSGSRSASRSGRRTPGRPWRTGSHAVPGYRQVQDRTGLTREELHDLGQVRQDGPPVRIAPSCATRDSGREVRSTPSTARLRSSG